MDASVLDVSISHSSKLLAEVRGVLVFDVFDDRFPASIIVDHIAIAGCVNNVQAKLYVVLHHDCKMYNDQNTDQAQRIWQ